ncbi:MAG: YcjX family protein [Bosea sp. (in: a-proteobacteria)]
MSTVSTGWLDSVRHTVLSLGDALIGVANPTLRLGVTGLSRSGKTVFTTALVHHLTGGTRLPLLRASAEGRIARAKLTPQPDQDVPRFPYEQHLQSLTGPERSWPQSTRKISELRLEIDYERASGWRTGPATLTLDIVDYPGEWLLDLGLIGMSFADWSRRTIADARKAHRLPFSGEWLALCATLAPDAASDEVAAHGASEAFKGYLAALRADPEMVAVTPPGRFLMPGDLEGSPALTFAPLDGVSDGTAKPGSLGALMEQRFEAYKNLVARPFFRDHFARLDRQIVLVDVLAALDAGPTALADLETALGDTLSALSVGRNSLFSSLFSPRIDKVLFAATKADHVHHSEHERLERIMEMIVGRAKSRAEASGAEVGAMAFAAVRATRDVRVEDRGKSLNAIAGTPENGEVIGTETFDGLTDAAVFPGSLPANPAAVFDRDGEHWQVRAPRFRPPLVLPDAGGRQPTLPHLRLDRVLDFLIGDRLG